MDGWTGTLAAFRAELRAADASDETIALRMTHLGWWRRRCPRSPWDATRTDLVEFMACPRWAPETRRSVRSSLRTFYGWAFREGLTEIDPAARLPRVRVPIAEPRPAPDHAIRTALAVADDRQRLMVLLGAVGGLRRKEVAQVHARDLDGDALRVHGKGGRERVVALPPSLARRVRDRGDGWAFPNGLGSHVTSAHVGVLLRRVLPSGVTPHMLRHAAASAMHDEGLTTLELRKFLGHASASTTQRYVAIRDRRLAEATAAAARRFAA